jgi:CheY-like chemotaxis protein
MVKKCPQRLLVVDDHVDGADLLAQLLRLSGAEVRVAYRGQDALTIGAEFMPDAILLDLAMPGMDGYETARRIRQEPWGGHVLLVAVTAWIAGEAPERATGFDHVLIKPVLAGHLEEVLGLSLPPARTV